MHVPLGDLVMLALMTFQAVRCAESALLAMFLLQSALHVMPVKDFWCEMFPMRCSNLAYLTTWRYCLQSSHGLLAPSFAILLLTGLFGQLPLADVSKQGQKVLIASSIPHFVLTWQSPEVFFTATGAPHLDQPPTTQWKVESHSFDQLTLHGDIQMPLDTSMGHLHFKFPRAFIATGHMAALKSLQRVLGFGPSFGMVQLVLSIHSCFFAKEPYCFFANAACLKQIEAWGTCL